MTDFGYLDKVPPETITDESAFKPINGAYVCRVEALEHVVGVSKKNNEPFDFYSLNTQVTEVMEGDKGVNRYLKKTYQNDEKGIKKLRDEMFTASLSELLDFSNSETLDASANLIKDKTINVRAWNPAKVILNKETGEWEVPDKDVRVQRIKVVKEFKLKGLKTAKDVNDVKPESEVPF